jgi:UDP:flavonoid glycosyltransferase YjiC (YdhE family)
MRRPRVLFYAINGLGLGHVTRLLAIGRKLRVRIPEAEIVYFTSSEAEDVIFREGFAAFKVPSKTLRNEARIRPATFARMLHTVTLNLLAAFHPHVLVVDTFPAGTLQELLPVLRWDSRKVFVFRVQRPEAARSPLLQGALALYDLVIVPHAAGEVDVPTPEGMHTVWTGPILIRDSAETRTRADARAALGLPGDDPVMYVTFGGGGDAAMDSALATTVDALRDAPCHLAVACAPLYRGRVGTGPPRSVSRTTIVQHYPMAEMMPAFDAAISAAGYNSTMELLHHGVPTALVPFPRQVDDQEARAVEMEECGAALRLAEISAEAITGAATRLMDAPTARALRERAQLRVPDSGADRAAAAIEALIA